MDPDRFDRLSKHFAVRGFSRRQALRGFGATGLAGAIFGLRREPAAADCADMTWCYRGCLPEELSEGGWCNTISSGPMPGGPVGMCWNWSEFRCNPCSMTQDQLTARCNTYTWCKGQCWAIPSMP